MNESLFKREVYEIKDIADLHLRLHELNGSSKSTRAVRLEIGASGAHTSLLVHVPKQDLVNAFQNLLQNLGAVPLPLISKQLQQLNEKAGLLPEERVVAEHQVAEAVVKKLDETYNLPRKKAN